MRMPSVTDQVPQKRFSVLLKHGDCQTAERLDWTLQLATVLPELDDEVLGHETAQHP